MRGKVTLDDFSHEQLRITPAYAGKSSLVISITLPVSGSPPPMRGKGQPETLYDLARGITPAYAGKSAQIEQAKFVPQDHPRLCGEKFRFLEISPAHEGSPPPMRGKVDLTKYEEIFQRITPAYAGKRFLDRSI